MILINCVLIWHIKDDEVPATTYTMLMLLHFFQVVSRSGIALGLLLSSLIAFPRPAQAIESPVGIDQLPVCMNFSCRRKEIVELSHEDWESIANWLKQPAPDAAAERNNIKQAIGWMEVVVGRYTPTHLDVGGDLQNGKVTFPGQLDCIDESLNTTTYLKLFEQNNLLKYHTVIERAYRRSIFDQHWAGQLQTLEGGERWVVDSWFQDNGYLPYIQRSEEWEKIPFFTSYLDSSQEKPEKKDSFFRRMFSSGSTE